MRLFHWSSENHHIGRADGAVRLIDELASLKLHAGQRVLLWGHSHAGNVFALATNLLARDREAVERFFAAAEIYYRWPLLRLRRHSRVGAACDALSSGTSPLGDVALDMVTFGTPIRYGWDADGYARLLHFIHHRPAEGLPDYRAPFPPRLHDVVEGDDGDYIQQLGIAGTNIMPSIFAWRAWMADQRLNRLLQDDTSVGGAARALPGRGDRARRRHDAAGRLRPALRRHRPAPGRPRRLHPQTWLLFHAEEVARRFYPHETTAER